MNSEVIENEETSLESTENVESTIQVDTSLEDVSSDIDIDLSATDEVITYGNYEVYDGSISTTYTTYFTGYASKRDYGDNYVLFRGSSYSYIYIEGDLSSDGGAITGSGNVYTLSTYGEHTVSNVYDSDIYIRDNGNMIYSDISGYPSLPVGVSENMFYSLYFGFVVIVLAVLMNGWFSYGKNRNIYIGSNS